VAPVAVFYTNDLRDLYHYIESPAMFHEERIVAAMQAAASGDTREQARDQFIRRLGRAEQVSRHQ
jgi:hypothetical protein